MVPPPLKGRSFSELLRLHQGCRASFWLALSLAVAQFWSVDAHAGGVATTDLQMSALLDEADSAFVDGNRADARRLYEVILQQAPEQSRAIYQLARLQMPGSPAALGGFRRYVELEPGDPWGRMALGDALAAAGKIDEGLEQYHFAERMAPAENDVFAGRARILQAAGRVDALISNQTRWTQQHPRQALVWLELGKSRQRARHHAEAAAAYARAAELEPTAQTDSLLRNAVVEAGPAMRVSAGLSRDSDNVSLRQHGLALEWGMAPRLRVGVQLDRVEVEDRVEDASVEQVGITALWQPLASLRLEGLVGLTQLDQQIGGEDPVLARLRLRYRPGHDAMAADLRFSQVPLVSTPGLVADPVELSEVRGWLEYPLFGPLRARGGGEHARLRERLQVNDRSGYQAGLIYRWNPERELSLTWKHLGYDRRSQAPYFSPRDLEVVDLGLYFESSHYWPFTLVFDAGLGRQRITRFGEAPRDWTDAHRLFTSLEWNVGAGARIALEYEFNSSPLGSDGIAPEADWKYHSLLLTLRTGLRDKTVSDLHFRSQTVPGGQP